MISPVLPRHALALTPRALVCAVALGFGATYAFADELAVPSVVVGAARFASNPDLLPIGATVIGADDIARAGVGDVNAAIRKIGGVYGRQSLDGSSDFTLDLRGFGTNSSQNMVVMLDGVRLTESELATTILSTIPIDTVERIEIIRGGASVLFGDGATGGVIQIFTRRPTRRGVSGSVRTEFGQFGLRGVRAQLSHSSDGLAFDAAVGDERTDNYRANNAFRQTNFSGGAQWNYAGGRAGIRIESARQDARFPGALTLAQFGADPRQTLTPTDFGKQDIDRVSAFVAQRVASVDLAAELSQRWKSGESSFFGSRSTFNGTQTQFSPRLRQLAHWEGMLNEFVAGVDLIRWRHDSNGDFSKADTTQQSKALYLRNELKFDAEHDGRIALGVRRERFDKDFVDPVPVGFGSTAYVARQTQNAWELQGSYRVLPWANAYARAGQSYRVANADENAYTPVPNQTLKGQRSHDLELGVSLGDAMQMLTARWFRHQLSDEIFFDPTRFANVNLDPTRRVGAELDAQASIAPHWRVSAHVQHVKASFTGGPNAGREMVLVPANVVSARLSWTPNDGNSADIGVQWADSQRYGNDFNNSCNARVPSAATIDGRLARQIGAWEVAVSGQNLANKQSFNQAFGCKAGIYPSDGRQLKLSARVAF